MQLVSPILLLIMVGALGVYGMWAESWPALLCSGVIGAVAVCLVPRNALPAAALWIVVLLPIGYIGVPILVGRYLTPAVIIIAVWMFRLAVADRRATIRGGLIAAPFLMLLLASAAYTQNSNRTFAWTAAFIVCVVAPALLGQVCRDDVWRTLRPTLGGIGLFLGVLAVCDFFLHLNPWTEWYVYVRTWTSGFRTTTSLGHPLTTGLVASVALVACVFPSPRARQGPYWLCAVGALAAIVLSVSRTSVIAVGVSAVIGIFSARSGAATTQERGHRGRRLVLLVAGATFFGAVAFSPLLSRRNASEEAANSASYRSALVDSAQRLISEHPWFGFGPGTSNLVYEQSDSSDALENSALQLVVSIGVPASLLLLLGLGVIVGVAMRRSRAGAAAGIVAFLVSATGFNVIDSNPAFLTLLAPLIVCAVMPRPTFVDEAKSNATSDRTVPCPAGDERRLHVGPGNQRKVSARAPQSSAISR
ncbi:O-antigen ligase family protein [Mycobacterium sp. ENV421]|uniref:O-antigen ligase family protein n=1 Tax=Mycobacterium sp. ENV421 TaxID=1213407 RepID=UPI001304AFA4|nr:O-antigen ligase family protein [Mycobacterium sp. ENV421]